MYNILIISHGSIAESFLSTLEMIMGKQEGIAALGIQPDEGSGDFEKRVIRVTEEYHKKEGLLIFVDLYGGTPCNITINSILAHYENVKVISGINLPMLMESTIYRSKDLGDVVPKLVETGKYGIIDVNKKIEENSSMHEDDE